MTRQEIFAFFQQREILTSCEACPTRQLTRSFSELDHQKRNRLKTFADRLKLVPNVRSQGELKIKIKIIMRINDGINVSVLSISHPINFNCRDFKCKDTVVSLYDLVGGNLEVKMTGNRSYLGLPNRTLGKFPKFLAGIPDLCCFTMYKNVLAKTRLIIHLRQCVHS